MDRHGKLVKSDCCAICMAFIAALNVSKIYFSTESGKIVCRRLRDMCFDVFSGGINKSLLSKLNPSTGDILIVLIRTIKGDGDAPLTTREKSRKRLLG